MLLWAYENWAKANGAHRAMIAVHTAIHPEKTGQFYERAGYVYMGGVYRKDF